MAAIEQRVAEQDREACRLAASAFLSRRARVYYALLGLGVVLFFAGLVAAGSAQSSAEGLAKNGARVAATVTGSWPTRVDRIDPHLTVSYPTQSGVETNVTVFTGYSYPSPYQVGQRVEISYDRSDPSRAVLVKGASASPILALYLFGLVLGVVLVLVAVASLLARRQYRAALAQQATRVLVDTARLGRSTVARINDGTGQPAAITVQFGGNWPGYEINDAIPCLAFRDSESTRFPTIVVDEATGAVMAGRLTRQATHWLSTHPLPSPA